MLIVEYRVKWTLSWLTHFIEIKWHIVAMNLPDKIYMENNLNLKWGREWVGIVFTQGRCLSKNFNEQAWNNRLCHETSFPSLCVLRQHFFTCRYTASRCFYAMFPLKEIANRITDCFKPWFPHLAVITCQQFYVLF